MHSDHFEARARSVDPPEARYLGRASRALDIAWRDTTPVAMKPLTQRAMEPTKASFATVHWDQEVESATAPDGHVRVHQSSPPPVSLGRPSGLARSQQLYMMQRFLNIPATPSYVEKDGGLVLDRVVANVGGKSWWHTLTLRLRAQRAWNTQEFSKGKPHQVLGDPSMYALGGRVRVGFGPNTVLKAVGELGSLKPWAERFRRLTGRDPNVQNPANVPAAPPLPHEEKPRGRVTLQSKSIPFHLVQFDVSHRERYQTPGGYRDGPSHASASVSSRGPQPFNYRFGVRQWLDDTIPAFERTPGSAALRPPPRREFTAGASLEHQATLWRGEPPRASARSPSRGYAALPQLPCVSVGALVGAVARVPLLTPRGIGRRDEWKDDTWRGVSARVVWLVQSTAAGLHRGGSAVRRGGGAAPRAAERSETTGGDVHHRTRGEFQR